MPRAIKALPHHDAPVVDLKTGLMTREWYENNSERIASLLSRIDALETDVAALGPPRSSVIFMEDYGMVGDYLIGGAVNPSYTDNSPGWNAAIAAGGEFTTFILPAGYCGFNSQPDALPDNCRLTGSGSFTALCQLYAPPAFGTIFIEVGIDQCTVENIHLFCVSSGSGVAIGRVATDSTDAPQRTILRNLVFSTFTANKWHGGVWLDGILGAAAFGSRRHILDGLLVQSITGWGVRLGGVNLCTGTNLYLPGTLGAHIEGTAGNPTTHVVLHGIVGEAQLVWTSNSAIHGGHFALITTDANSNSNAFFGTTVDSHTLSGTNNHIYHNGTIV